MNKSIKMKGIPNLKCPENHCFPHMFRNVSARKDVNKNSKTTMLQLEEYFRVDIFVSYFTPCFLFN